jgi:NAD(P)-dependent dehydrogenase (short-subunit alcohol dehydrogenase family)
MEMGLSIVAGASGGIGRALVVQLEQSGPVLALSRQGSPPCDPLNEASISAALARVGTPVTRLIVTTGMLHDVIQGPEKSWRDLDADRLARSFAINAMAPALFIKHCIPLFPRTGRVEVAALSARVGSISDNQTGGWHGYRASKAALNQLIKTISIELARTHPDLVCVALHPGTVDTAMSKPFQRGVAPEKLFTPAFSAARLLEVLATLQPADSGGHFAWNGSVIPA